MEYDSQGFVPASDGTPIFYGVRGTGSPIILCDGLGCAGFAWRYLHPKLAGSHRVVHWHYRGHGRSGLPPDPKSTSIETLADDLARLMDALSLEPSTVVGHSMGTQVALETYRLVPDRVSTLVLLCGSHGRVTSHFHGTDTLKQVLPGVIDIVKQRRGWARALWGRVPASMAYRVGKLSGEFNGVDFREEDFKAYWEHIALLDPDLFLATLRAAGDHSAEDLLPTIDVPTLVVGADNDTFTPPARARQMAEQIPASSFHLLEDSSHAAPVEQPMTIFQLMQDFLVSRLNSDSDVPTEFASDVDAE